jgi:hypothetical protein
VGAGINALPALAWRGLIAALRWPVRAWIDWEILSQPTAGFLRRPSRVTIAQRAGIEFGFSFRMSLTV